MLSGHVFRRQMWAPAIGVIGGGLLRTPTVGMINQDRSQDPQYMSKLLAKGQTVTLAAQMKSAQMLPTPKACDGERGRDKARARPDTKSRELATVVRDQMLPTPNAGEAKQTGNVENWQRRQSLKAQQGQNLQMPLSVAVKMLPTPVANNSKNASLPPSQAERNSLAGAMLRDDSIPTGAATYLNPSFVEEMMGFPVGWTA